MDRPWTQPIVLSDSLGQLQPGTRVENQEISSEVSVTPRDSIAVLYRISFGAFGKVFKAKLANKFDSVACKAPRLDRMSYLELVHEVNIMADLQHENVVRLIGISDHYPIPWMILELMQHGDLLCFIERRRERKIPVDQTLWTKMALDVASGMEYLHWEKLLVHCDLHTRNCMVGTNNVVKVGDFGLSFRYDSADAELRILSGDTGTNGRPNTPPRALVGARWKAPELIPGRSFRPVLTRPCDVWAFGILLYELWTEGRIPYDATSSSHEMGLVITSGGTPLDFYSNVDAPERIVELMKSTWAFSPNGRPNFKTIVDILKDVLASIPQPVRPADADSDSSGSPGPSSTTGK